MTGMAAEGETEPALKKRAVAAENNSGGTGVAAASSTGQLFERNSSVASSAAEDVYNDVSSPSTQRGSTMSGPHSRQ